MPKKIRDLMTTELVTFPADATVLDAAKCMRDAGIGGVIVLEDDAICGIVTDRDLVVRAIARERDPRTTTLGDICSRDLTTVAPDDQIGRAIQLMRDKAVRRLPVVEKGQPVGILSLGDLVLDRDRESALAAISMAPANQ